MKQRITLTKKQMTRQWFFVKYFFPEEQRVAIMKAFIANRDKIDKNHIVEIAMPCKN